METRRLRALQAHLGPAASRSPAGATASSSPTASTQGRAPVKVGVVGMGSFGRLHALTLAGLAEAELVAVVARRQVSLDEFAQDQPDVPGYLDLATAIEESGAEAWVVATSNATHVPFTKQLLEAGKAVLLEKPVADTVEEAESLGPLVAADSSNLMVGHILLFSSEYQHMFMEARNRGPISLIDGTRHLSDQNVNSKQPNGVNPAGQIFPVFPPFSPPFFPIFSPFLGQARPPCTAPWSIISTPSRP